MSTPEASTDAPPVPPSSPPAAEIQDNEGYPSDVQILHLDGRRFVLVGTAHISQSSVDLVREVIERERPDRVCVELDPQRFQSLSEQKSWESLDLKQVIRRKQLTTLIVNLLLASYQKRLGAELGVAPGTELLEATRVADTLGIPVDLADRDVRITLRRAVSATPFWRRIYVLSELMLGMFDGNEVTEEQLQELREQDVLTEMMNELGRRHPSLKRVLIDERDAYLSHKIMNAEGQTVVAVVGAGHVQGIKDALVNHREADLEALETVPPVSPVWKVAGWAIPVLILGAIAWIGHSQGIDAATDNAVFWILANGIPASLGALIAWAHPLTIVAAFVAAPITSLTPVIGAAYVTAFVQAWVAPPKVKEFQTVADDAGKLGNWWKNRLLKILLAYILPGLGSMLGSVIGIGEILSNV